MTGNVIGLFYDHWTRIRETPTTWRNPFSLWTKAVWYKANPRSADYMKVILAERYPQAAFLDIGSDPLAPGPLKDASKVILLYPDAIGLGFTPVERDIARHAPQTPVEILNGRRRQFAFDDESRRALRFRRLLEWTMLVECVTGIVILLATPFLLLADVVRGKK